MANIEQAHEQDLRQPEQRRKMMYLSELGLVAASALVFLLFLLGLIRIYFPQGSAFSSEYEVADFGTPSLADNVIVNVGVDDTVAAREFAAKIVKINRRVQRRDAESLAWNNAYVGDELVRNDAVQTFSRSVALLQINRNSHMTIGQNSLVVFDQQEVDPLTLSARSVLVMMNGELSGTFIPEGDGESEFDVNLPNADVTLSADRGGENIDFLITVNNDRSTTVNLHSGVAQVVSKSGVEQTIYSQYAVTIDEGGTEMQVSRIPDAPLAVGPDNRRVVKYREVPEPIEFEWQAVNDAEAYHLIIARDAELQDRVVDDQLAKNYFRHGALEAGSFFWTVRARTGWTQSEPRRPRELLVVQDRKPPELRLQQPDKVVAVGEWRLLGQTESNAVVFVDGIEIDTNEGRIDESITLQPGANVVTVRAVDDVGNHSYASLALSAK